MIFDGWTYHEFPLPEGVEMQDKCVHAFFINNSVFRLSLRLLREDVNFMLKVA